MVSIVAYMYRGPHQQQGSGAKVPHWSVERNPEYSLRRYAADIALWIQEEPTLTPSQQIAKIVRYGLSGEAENIGRNMTPTEMKEGGLVNGIQYDPVSLLIRSLEQRFGELEDETRLAAMNEFQSFRMHPGEKFDAFISRYEISRNRASRDGDYKQSAEQCAIQLVRVMGIGPQDLMALIAPFGNRLPTTERALQEMIGVIRRVKHITEHHPNNIAYSLGAPHEPRPGQYYTDMSEKAFQAWERQHMFPSIFDTPGDGDSPYRQHANFVPSSSSYGYFQGPSPSQYPAPVQDNSLTDAQEQDTDSSSDVTGTSTDTSSDNGSQSIDMQDIQNIPSSDRKAYALFQYRTAKKKWRRFANKPVRRFRRRIKDYKRRGKGKGKGKGKGGFSSGKGFFKRRSPKYGRSFYKETQLPISEVDLFLKRHRKKGPRRFTKTYATTQTFKSSGKGFGRQNPIDPATGKPRQCFNCGSETHLKSDCPSASAGKGGKGDSPAFPAITDVARWQGAEYSGKTYGVWDHEVPTAPAHQEPETTKFQLDYSANWDQNFANQISHYNVEAQRNSSRTQPSATDFHLSDAGDIGHRQYYMGSTIPGRPSSISSHSSMPSLVDSSEYATNSEEENEYERAGPFEQQWLAQGGRQAFDAWAASEAGNPNAADSEEGDEEASSNSEIDSDNPFHGHVAHHRDTPCWNRPPETTKFQESVYRPYGPLDDTETTKFQPHQDDLPSYLNIPGYEYSGDSCGLRRCVRRDILHTQQREYCSRCQKWFHLVHYRAHFEEDGCYTDDEEASDSEYHSPKSNISDEFDIRFLGDQDVPTWDTWPKDESTPRTSLAPNCDWDKDSVPKDGSARYPGVWERHHAYTINSSEARSERLIFQTRCRGFDSRVARYTRHGEVLPRVSISTLPDIESVSSEDSPGDTVIQLGDHIESEHSVHYMLAEDSQYAPPPMIRNAQAYDAYEQARHEHSLRAAEGSPVYQHTEPQEFAPGLMPKGLSDGSVATGEKVTFQEYAARDFNTAVEYMSRKDLKETDHMLPRSTLKSFTTDNIPPPHTVRLVPEINRHLDVVQETLGVSTIRQLNTRHMNLIKRKDYKDSVDVAKAAQYHDLQHLGNVTEDEVAHLKTLRKVMACDCQSCTRFKAQIEKRPIRSMQPQCSSLMDLYCTKDEKVWSSSGAPERSQRHPATRDNIFGSDYRRSQPDSLFSKHPAFTEDGYLYGPGWDRHMQASREEETRQKSLPSNPPCGVRWDGQHVMTANGQMPAPNLNQHDRDPYKERYKLDVRLPSETHLERLAAPGLSERTTYRTGTMSVGGTYEGPNGAPPINFKYGSLGCLPSSGVYEPPATLTSRTVPVPAELIHGEGAEGVILQTTGPMQCKYPDDPHMHLDILQTRGTDIAQLGWFPGSGDELVRWKGTKEGFPPAACLSEGARHHPRAFIQKTLYDSGSYPLTPEAIRDYARTVKEICARFPHACRKTTFNFMASKRHSQPH